MRRFLGLSLLPLSRLPLSRLPLSRLPLPRGGVLGLAALGLAAGLSGCGEPAPAPLPPGGATDVRELGTLENVWNVESVQVRSFRIGPEGTEVEFAGADCELRSALHRVRLTTPAVVGLPTYLQAERFQNRGRPPALKGSCRYGGKRVAVELKPTSAVGHTTFSNKTTHYTPHGPTSYSASTTTLTGRLSPTLPWRYVHHNVKF